ncbi:zinc finger protein 512B-like [Galendromus occidentalis]|uniref:Zinc finger protein 512B-like n=1 Tax=Galendromus occidentalis TaxID=34638 RepID=A0AAJ7SH21_9ACAR|nr:zinc finger protein 512B-like [Galendromus occidentalis]
MIPRPHWISFLVIHALFSSVASIWKPESVVKIIRRVVPVAHPVHVYKAVRVPHYYPVYKQVHVPYPVKVPYWIPVTKHVPKIMPIAKIIPLPKIRIVKKYFGIPVPKPYIRHKALPIYKPVPYKRTMYVPKPVKVPHVYPVHIHKVIHVPKPYHVPVTIPIFKPVFVKRHIHVPYPVYVRRKSYHHHPSYGKNRHRSYHYSYGHSKHKPQYAMHVDPGIIEMSHKDRKPASPRPKKPWHNFGKPETSDENEDQADRSPEFDLPSKSHKDSDSRRPQDPPKKFQITEPSFEKVHRRPDLSHHRPQYAAHSMPQAVTQNSPNRKSTPPPEDARPSGVLEFIDSNSSRPQDNKNLWDNMMKKFNWMGRR